MPIVKCDYCGKEFEKENCYIKRTKRNFCSYECHYKSNYNNKCIDFYKYSILIVKKVNKEIYFLLDREDIPKIKKYHWRARYTRTTNTYYAETGKGENRIQLHRLLMDCPEGFVIDHINRNPLDNRKVNLRICTQAENMQNKSVYKNNKLNQQNIRIVNNKYIVRITINKKTKNLGSFNNLNEAIKVRDKALKERLEVISDDKLISTSN